MAAAAFQEKLEELAGDRFEVTIYPSAQLGGEREMAEGVKIGSIELCDCNNGWRASKLRAETQVLAILHLFADKQEAYYVLDNTLQKELEPKFEAQGFKHLVSVSVGFRHFTNNKKK